MSQNPEGFGKSFADGFLRAKPARRGALHFRILHPVNVPLVAVGQEVASCAVCGRRATKKRTYLAVPQAFNATRGVWVDHGEPEQLLECLCDEHSGRVLEKGRLVSIPVSPAEVPSEDAGKPRPEAVKLDGLTVVESRN